MIKSMITYMDEVTEAIRESAETLAEFTFGLVGYLLKLLIVIFAPVWIVPYMIFRRK